MPRTKLHFHLLSYLVAMLAVSVLLGINTLTYTQTIESYHPANPTEDYVLYAHRTYGWPFAAARHRGILIPLEMLKNYREFDAMLDTKENATVYWHGELLKRIPEGILKLFKYEITYWALLGNIVTALAGSTLALSTSELLLRRRESRLHAS